MDIRKSRRDCALSLVIMVWSEIENILGGSLQEALIGDKTPEQALNEANAAIAQTLK